MEISLDKISSHAFKIAILIACITVITLLVLTINVIVNPMVDDYPAIVDYGRNIFEIGLAGFLTSILLFIYHLKKDKGISYLSIAFALLFLVHFMDIFTSYTRLQWIGATGNYTHFLEIHLSVMRTRATFFYILYPLAIWIGLYGITCLIGTRAKNLYKNLVYASIIVMFSGLLPWFQIGDLLMSLTWTSPVVWDLPERIESAVYYPLQLIYYLLMISSTSLLSASIFNGKVRKLLIIASGSCSLFSCIYFLSSVFSDQAILLLGGPSIGPFASLIGSFGLFYIFLFKKATNTDL